MPLYPRPVAAFFGRPSEALTPALPQGCTQGTRPASSSAMILSVTSWYRLALSGKALRAGVAAMARISATGGREPLVRREVVWVIVLLRYQGVT